jgi:hypothetical protein
VKNSWLLKFQKHCTQVTSEILTLQYDCTAIHIHSLWFNQCASFWNACMRMQQLIFIWLNLNYIWLFVCHSDLIEVCNILCHTYSVTFVHMIDKTTLRNTRFMLPLALWLKPVMHNSKSKWQNCVLECLLCCFSTIFYDVNFVNLMRYCGVHMILASFDSNRLFLWPMQHCWVGVGDNDKLPLVIYQFPVKDTLLCSQEMQVTTYWEGWPWLNSCLQCCSESSKADTAIRFAAVY